MAWRERVKRLILDYALPFGMLCMLTGMMWLGGRGQYPKIFLAFAIPALVLLALAPSSFRKFLRSPTVAAFVAFAAYFSVSIAWSATEDSFADLIKRPLLLLVLFFGVTEFARMRPQGFCTAIAISAIVAPITATYEISQFFISNNAERLASKGALNNPLLISHVYGFFAALWLGWLYTQPNLRKAAHGILATLILLCLLALTGSRTPLAAITATAIALTIVTGHRKGILMLAALAAIGLAGVVLMPGAITQRGFSYRPEIWSEALRQILEYPWLGHGFGSPLFIKIADIPYSFRDPHNLTLAVLFDGGLIGLLAWMSIYVAAFTTIWKHRQHPWAIICSATVVYGLVAGMTEGGSFLSRPKEHWFLIWIPLALAASIPTGGMSRGQSA